MREKEWDHFKNKDFLSDLNLRAAPPSSRIWICREQACRAKFSQSDRCSSCNEFLVFLLVRFPKIIDQITFVRNMCYFDCLSRICLALEENDDFVFEEKLHPYFEFPIYHLHIFLKKCYFL